jgi:hypothetical protein
MTARLVLLIAAFGVTPALAADPPGQANRDALKKLDYLAGKWKGEATIQMGPGRKETLTQTEDVEYRLGGTILVVEGIGRGKLPGQDKEGVVFNAFAVLSYDAAKKEYALKAYRAEGLSVDAYVKPAAKGFEWGFKEPQRGFDIRYTMKLTDKGEWNEVGEMSMDGGKAWNKFFEMVLTKVKE